MNPWGPNGKPASIGVTRRPDPRTEAANFRYRPPGDTVRRFMLSDAFVRGLRGPIGSGKSTGCCAEILRRASMQKPSPDGIRKTRWAVIRNTSPELRTTTMKTWAQIIPERHWGPIRWSAPYTHHIRKGDLDCEVIFLGLDKPDDMKKLLSLELTGAWVNEAREVPKAIIDGVTSRVGRYPPPFEGGPSWWGVWMDTNAPDVDHWWPILSGEAPIPDYLSYEESLMMQKPDGWEFFTQPAAMVEVKDAGELSGYAMSPEAENVANLPPGYYDKLIQGKTRSWINVYVLNKLGHENRGKPVYKDFSPEFHVSRETIAYDPEYPVVVGLDFGLSPAAVAAQNVRGQWRVFWELIGTDMGALRFGQRLARELAAMVPKKDWKQRVRFYGDPSGDGRSDADENTPYRIFAGLGIQIVPAPSNDTTVRIQTVERLLATNLEGRPAMIFCPTKCRTLVTALSGGYRYRQLQISGGGGEARFEEKPEKNRFSHPADAHQYLVLGAGEGRETLRPPASPVSNQGRVARSAGIMERRRLRDRIMTRRERVGRV